MTPEDAKESLEFEIVNFPARQDSMPNTMSTTADEFTEPTKKLGFFSRKPSEKQPVPK